MINLQWVESVFLLSEQQKALLPQLEAYEVYFCMLRYDYLENAAGIAAMVDFFYYLHEEEQLLFNSEVTMYYLLRYSVVEATIDLINLDRMKHYTVGHMDRSLIGAALTTNIMLDIYRKIRPFFNPEEIQFIWKYVKRPKKLFDVKFQTIETYPKKYVLIETKMLQMMRTYMTDHKQELQEQAQAIHRFMDAYVYEDQQLFTKGRLK